MKAEIKRLYEMLTWRFIMAFGNDWTESAVTCAAGVSHAPIGAQLPGNYCKFFKEIFSGDRFECNLEMSAKFGTHNDPSPVRIVLTTTRFFLIQTPFVLTTT